MMQPEVPVLTTELKQLEEEHLELNKIMDDPVLHTKFDQLTIQRLKKRKLFLKDKITYIKGLIWPDIIA